MPLDFRGKPVRGRSFRGRKDLGGADFSGCDLSSADFRECDLRGAKFDNAVLLSTRFDRADLTGASFVGSRMGRTWGWSALVQALGFLAGVVSSAFAVIFLSALAQPAFKGDADSWTFAAILIPTVIWMVVLACYGTKAGYAGAVVGAIAGAGAAANAGVVAGVVAVVIAGAAAAAIVGAIAVSVAVSVAGAGAVAVSGAAIMAVAGARAQEGAVAYALAGGIVLGLVLVIYRQSRRDRPGFRPLHVLKIRVQSIGGTSFRAATLSDADFSDACFEGSNFRSAILLRTRWRDSVCPERAWWGNESWLDPVLRKLLVTGEGREAKLGGRHLAGVNLAGADLRGADLSHTDLTNASLRGADLTNANLAETQGLGADFQEATLTGSCLRDWNIDAATKLGGVHCDFFFLLEKENEKGNRDRRPHQPDAIFQRGVFEKLFSEVRDTIHLLIKQDAAMGTWSTAFRRLMSEYPEIRAESIQSIKRAGDLCVITLEAPTGIDKQGVAEAFDAACLRQIEQPVAENRVAFPIQFDAPPVVKANVFVSYAHRDEEELLQEFLAQAASLRREGLVEVWHDRAIPPGGEWRNQINERLLQADLIVLLVSHYFIASDDCFAEVEAALARHHRGEAIVLPVIARVCEWQQLPFGRLQAAPKNGKAVESWHNRNEAWTDVVRSIRRAVADLGERRTKARSAAQP